MLGSCDICKGAGDLGGGGLGPRTWPGREVARKFKGFLRLRKTNASFVCSFPPGFFRSSVVEFETSLSERNTKVMWILRVAKNQRLFKE